MTFYRWQYRFEGEKNRNAKLTDDDVRDIRASAKQGVSAEELAEKYKMNARSIKHIIRGTRWRHVK